MRRLALPDNPGRPARAEASGESDGERHAIDIDALGDAFAFARKSRSEWLLPRAAAGTVQAVWAVTIVAGQSPTVIEHASLCDGSASHWRARRVRALRRERGLCGGAAAEGGGWHARRALVRVGEGVTVSSDRPGDQD